MKPWNSTLRFWSKVDKHSSNGCWIWTACKDPNGYGRFRKDGGGASLAHRISYEMVVGEIPTGMELDHKCSNPSCVNPDHLRLCTSSENKCNRKHGKVCSSGYRGVTKHGRGWRAKICKHGVVKYLGVFDTPERAFSAYCDAARAMFGDFANVPDLVRS